MSEFQPIARSPIAAYSLTVHEGWEVSTAIRDAALRIEDCTPMAKIIVRANSDGPAAEVLAVAHGRTRRDGDVLVVGSSPGEWMLIAGPRAGAAHALAQRAHTADPEEFTSVIDQTHGRALLRITGQAAVQLLAKLCAIDFHDRVTPDGTAFRSSVAGLVTDVVRDDDEGTPSYLLHCERSSGQFLFDALLDAGAEFGIEFGIGAGIKPGSRG